MLSRVQKTGTKGVGLSSVLNWAPQWSSITLSVLELTHITIFYVASQFDISQQVSCKEGVLFFVLWYFLNAEIIYGGKEKTFHGEKCFIFQYFVFIWKSSLCQLANCTLFLAETFSRFGNNITRNKSQRFYFGS